MNMNSGGVMNSAGDMNGGGVMNVGDVLSNKLHALIGFVVHHLGLTMILIAWLSIIVLKFRGLKIYLPGYFFILYGIGSLLLSYSMWVKNESMAVALLEGFIGISAILLQFL